VSGVVKKREAAAANSHWHLEKGRRVARDMKRGRRGKQHEKRLLWPPRGVEFFLF
jgi:hypothetical protein